jgi:ADP-heptose:LPS heptosyltransferase
MKGQKPNKILIIRLSSIGDIVLTTPIIRCVKQAYPEAEIHYLTKASFKNIISNNPYISHLHFYKGNLKRTIKSLRAQNFDIVIDLHNNIRTWRIKFALKAQTFTFDKLNFQKWLMVNFKKDTLPEKHIVDRYFEAVAPLGVVNDGEGLEFHISPVDEVSLDLLPEKFRKGYTAFVIGGTYNTKKLTNKKIISICSKTDQPIVLLGGSHDLENAIEIKKALGDKIYNAVNKFGIAQSASLIRQSNHVISHDTGLMHIAAAFKKPIVSVWGNTIPGFGMNPYFGNDKLAQQNSLIVEVNGLSCRPCSKLGYSKCPKGHFKCMKDIDEEMIVSAIAVDSKALI